MKKVTMRIVFVINSLSDSLPVVVFPVILFHDQKVYSLHTILHYFFFTTFSNSMMGRCFGPVVTMLTDLAPLRPTIPSPSNHARCSSSSPVSFFLSFYSPAHPCTPCYPYTSPPFVTCPYHFILPYWTSMDISPTFVVNIIISFLILSIFVIPHIHLHILIYANRTSSSIALFSANDRPAMMYGR